MGLLYGRGPGRMFVMSYVLCIVFRALAVRSRGRCRM